MNLLLDSHGKSKGVNIVQNSNENEKIVSFKRKHRQPCDVTVGTSELTSFSISVRVWWAEPRTSQSIPEASRLLAKQKRDS